MGRTSNECSTRAVLLSSCRTAGVALEHCVAELAERHAEVVVAIDDLEADASLAPLAQRWARVRAMFSGRSGVWVTPLVRAPGLSSLADRAAALQVRLGPIDELRVESTRWLPFAGALGLHVKASPELSDPDDVPMPPVLGSRALVVLRAQPFHLGHLALIERALSVMDEALVVVAAAERSFTPRDPFTAGERLALLRAGLGDLASRIWLVALPAPAWPAMALMQLAFVAPSYEVVVAHNPILRELAAQHGKAVTELSQPLQVAGQRVSASLIRARLVTQGAGSWLADFLPAGTAELLQSAPSLAARCALIATAGE